MKKSIQVLINLTAITAILIGAYITNYPYIQNYFTEKEISLEMKRFQQLYAIKEHNKEMITAAAGNQKNEKEIKQKAKESDPLYQEMKVFNDKIFKDGQTGYCDLWNVEETPIEFKESITDMIGYIEIPDMNSQLPIYVGASNDHLKKGTAVLGYTSMPIGGINTNSVIAGHRGWTTGNFWKDIEKVKIGGKVYVTNPWETLCYEVEDILIATPQCGDKLKIQRNKDMLTLLTCHPYGSHGKYRYIIYCERLADIEAAPSISVDEKENTDAGKEILVLRDTEGNVYELSGGEIRREHTIVIVVDIIIAILLLGLLVSLFRKK